MHLSTLVKRVAAVLVLVAALINGLTAPLAHGHLMGPPVHQAPSGDVAPAVAGSELGQLDDCDGSGEEVEASHDPTDSSHGKTPGNMQLICSGSGSCCAAVAIADLPVMATTAPTDTFVRLPLTLAGLSPPVGERPPLSPHV